MRFSELTPVQLYCPNCGVKLTGYKGEDGSVRICCNRCKVIIYSKQRNKNEIAIKVKRIS